MKLKSFGCSFIFGTDLSDCPEIKSKQSPPSESTWPALIAKNQGLEYHCMAWPGSGNFRILERIAFEATKDEDAIFMISWTWIDRLDYLLFPRSIYESWSWQSVMPNDTSDFAKSYYQKYHNQFKDQFSSVIYIQQAIDILKKNNKPFLMTYQDDLILDRSHDHSGLLQIQDDISSHLVSFQGKTFLDWSRDQKFKISALWHPLEEAHAAAADYLLENYWSDIKNHI